VTVRDTRGSTNIPLNFHLHHAWLDKSGQYVILESTAPDRGSPRYAAPLYVWDTSANTFTALPESGGLSGGHYATGFGTLVNQDCCTSTTWDAAQWQLRALPTPTASHDVISTVLTPQEVYASDHASWNNAQSGALVPFVTALFRSTSETAPWRAWDDEILAVQTSGGTGGATVWRFAQHRTIVVSFWDMPRANVSQDGRWALFTSNWEKTLGGNSSSGPREDVFMVELKAGDLSPSPSPAPSPTPAPSPPPSPTPTPAPAPTPTPAPAPPPTPAPAPAPGSFVPAQWMSLINVTASANSLQKTGGCGGCPDASAVSQQQGTALQFTASETGTLRIIGLGSGAIGGQPGDITFAFRLQAGTAEVRESGTYKGETSFATGDVLKVTADSGGVKYWKNGAAFYTSTSHPGQPLRIQAVLSDLNATLRDIVVLTGSSAPAVNASGAPVTRRP
jgi:cell division septation protein DedD